MLKARTVQSEETRQHLREAHQRVMSVATVQQQLQPSGLGDLIEAVRQPSKLDDRSQRPAFAPRAGRDRHRGIQSGGEPRARYHRARDQRPLSMRSPRITRVRSW